MTEQSRAEVEAFRKRLRDALAKSGMSQNALERRASLGRGYVSRLLKGARGNNMETKTLLAMCRELRVHPEWLWFGTGPRDVEGPMQGWEESASPRELAAHVARVLSVPDPSISAVLSQFESSNFDSLSAFWWLDQFRAHALEAARRPAEQQPVTQKRRRVRG